MIKIILLAIIQGLTEFLPISSSAHLVIFSHLMDLTQDMTLDVILHFGTALAVIAIFRQDLHKLLSGIFRKGPERRTILLLFLGTIPAGLIGFLWEDQFEIFFMNISYSAIFLIVTSLVLFLTRFVKNNDRPLEAITSKDALIIGLAQAAAILPGISRSAITIAAGLFLKIEEKTAIKFSFLLSLPIILGANGLKIKHLLSTHPSFAQIKVYLIGIVFAFISGVFAIKFLINMRKGKLFYFAFYCLFASILVLAI